MEARGAGPVTEWVVEEDARLILLSPPPGAVRERSISLCWGDGTRPGVRDGVSPPLAPSQGCEQETTCAEDVRATARGRAPWTESPLLSLPVRDASRRRRSPRRGDGTRPGAGVCFSPPFRSQEGCEQGTTMAVPRRYDGDEQTRSTLGRADPEQGPP